MNSSSANLEIILDEVFHRLSVFQSRTNAAAEIDKQLRLLETRLADQEAHYAQTQLVEFIRRDKYAHTPRNLAGAMAGLPFIGFWQSFQRCEEIPSPFWPMKPEEIQPFSYQVFALIERRWNRRLHSDNQLLLSVQDEIRSLPKSDPLRQHLTANRRYLRQAIEQVDLKELPSDRIPYRIFSILKINIGKPRSGEATILAEAEARQI